MFSNSRFVPSASLVFAVSALVVLMVLASQPLARAQPETSPRQLQLALARAGLTPESLTAAGVTPAAISADGGIADVVADYLAQHPSALESVDNALAQARQTHDTLERAIQSGQATPQQISQFPAARQALNDANANRHAAHDALFDVATDGLPTDQTNTLATLRGNRQWELPVEYLTVDRSQAQWVELRQALAHERIATQRQEPVNPEIAAMLAQERAVPAVNQAASRVAANLQAVTAAWNEATGGTQ